MAEQGARPRMNQLAKRAGLRRWITGCILLAVVIAACEDDVTVLRPVQPARALAVLELTYRDIGKPRMSSSVAVASSMGELEQLSAPYTSAAPGGRWLPLLQQARTRADFIMRFEAISTGLLDSTPPGGEGRRFLHSTFQVPGAFESQGPDPAADELILIAITTASTIGDTFVRLLHREDGSAADSSLARQLQPTGRPSLDSDGSVRVDSVNVLRLLNASEVASIGTPAGVSTVLPFAFIVRATNPQTSGRPDGTVTFAFSLPLLEPRDENPSILSVLLIAANPR